jgi:DNA-binding SARP family transcriptional activator/class 3 adenylate cyclase
LGPVEAAVGERRLAVGGPIQVKLLAYLLLHANRAVSADTLVDAVWGSDRSRARNRLQMAVVRLRKALDDQPGQVVRTVGGGYLLAVGPGELDAEAFDAQAEEGRRALNGGDPARASELLRGALALWRGPPLAEIAFEDFAQAEIRRLEELRLVALENRVKADLQLGRHAEVVGELEALLVRQPSREAFAGQLMLALYRCGRQTDALEVYQRTRARLVDELGLDPGPALKSLQAAILEQSPGLAASRGTCVGPAPERRPDIDARVTEEDPSDRRTDARCGGDEDGTPADLPSMRKVVTVLRCDVRSAIAVGGQLDPEWQRNMMDRCFEALRTVVYRHGGAVEKCVGDEVLAVFGIPRAHEDDALRAVRAAAETRDRIQAVAEGLGFAVRIRIAVATGLVLAGGREHVITGGPVSLTAELQVAARPGEILLDSESLQLVRDAVEVERLKPFRLQSASERVPVWRLVHVDPVAPGFARNFDGPLVGRRRELRLLREGWCRTVEQPGCHLFTLLGEAGVGKSRLVTELLAEVGDASLVLCGRCLPYGEGITFWPVIEALRPLGDGAKAVLDLLGGGVGMPEELFLQIRQLLESLAAARPVILFIDDLQWAEPMLLDLIDHIVDLSRGVPILVLCAARLDLIENRPEWGGGKMHATSALLEPLGASDCEALLGQLAGDLDREAGSQVIAASGGNPLFLQEMVAFMREQGTFAVPETIRALLAARLERLASDERELLQCGAVEGEVFHRRALLALFTEDRQGKLDALLSRLTRQELIRAHPATVEDDHAFRFRHLLIRDAAYGTLPKAARSNLHQRFAKWLEDSALDAVELDEIAGWHLEQAVRYRRELGLGVDSVLSRRAATHLDTAGRRARDRGDVAAARNLFERAFTIAPDREQLRVTIGVDLAERLIEDGELTRADELLTAGEIDPEVGALAAVSRLELLTRTQPHEAREIIQARLPGILERLTKAGDHRGIARAHMTEFWVHIIVCQWTSAGEQARLAAEHARRAGDEGLRTQALGGQLSALFYGGLHVNALAEALDELGREEVGPYLESRLLAHRASLARLRGHFDQARRLTLRAIEGHHALGLHETAAGTEVGLAITELSAGQPDAALAALLRSDAILSELGERSYRSTTQAMLARTHELRGDREAAIGAIILAEELGSPDDLLNKVIIARVRARLAVASGDYPGAESWARSAVQHALRTDNIILQADAKLALASVLSTIGQREEAVLDARDALGQYQIKGEVPGADRARTLLDGLALPT